MEIFGENIGHIPRDIERKKRCVFVPDIDEETGKQKFDKDGNPKEKPVFDISIYSQIDEDGMQLWETFVSGKTVEDVVFQNDQEMVFINERIYK